MHGCCAVAGQWCGRMGLRSCGAMVHGEAVQGTACCDMVPQSRNYAAPQLRAREACAAPEEAGEPRQQRIVLCRKTCMCGPCPLQCLRGGQGVSLRAFRILNPLISN